MVTVKETVVESANTPQAIERKAKVDSLGRAYATGKRKNSIARVWIKKGTGKITINEQDSVSYLKRAILSVIVNQPFAVIGMEGKFDVECTVKGGGLSGQAGAIRHGISGALQNFNPIFRADLKKAGFLTRDPRVVERKKPGRKKARKGQVYKKR